KATCSLFSRSSCPRRWTTRADGSSASLTNGIRSTPARDSGEGEDQARIAWHCLALWGQAIMTPPIIARERVAEQLAVPVSVLIRYESRGLVRPLRGEVGGVDVEGYGPVEIRRIWSILSFQRDLG